MNAAAGLQSKRGHQLFVLDGFSYHYHKMSADGETMFWRCSMRDDKLRPCPVRIHTRNNKLVKTLHEHTHKSSPATITAKQIVNGIKQRAVDSQEVNFQ